MNSKLKKAIKDFYLNGSLESMSDPKSVGVLQENNMVFPSEEIGHDELIEKLIHEAKLARKSEVVESFLAGLEHGEPQKRAVLSAYAISLNFPKHKFKSSENIQCSICGCFYKKIRNFTFCNLVRYTVGSSSAGSPEELYFFLREHNKSVPSSPRSIIVFKSILDLLRGSVPEDTPLTLERKIRDLPGIDMTKELSRGLVDLFGQIGVLETPDHKGFIYSYTYIGRAPKKSRSTDWSYPVDFWNGSYGVNEEAVDFWFGKYLKNYN